MSDQKDLNIGQNYEEQYGFHDPEKYVFKSKKGLTQTTVEEISEMKSEPEWMRNYRLKALKSYQQKPLPAWADLGMLTQIPYDDIYYYLKPMEEQGKTWEDVPADIKNTFDKLGIPEAERKFLAGVTAQYESEVVYHSINKELEKQGVIFLGMDQGLKQYPDLVKKYFGSVIPAADNKFSALNSAVWSGGSFIYVPKGVKVAIPLQAYFRINAKNMGQFERTLIIADEGSSVHYIEGCVMAGTPIATNPGYKPVEAIEPGERVLTHRGQYKRVLHTQVRPYSGRLFSIRMWGDAVAPLRITEEHPMLFVKRNGRNKPTAWKLQWGKPSDLRKGDYLVLPRRKETRTRQYGEFLIRLSVNDKKAIYQETVQRVPSTPEFFRLAGYFLAEGSILNNFYLSFSFGEHEHTYIEDVKSLLRTVFGVTKIHELHHKKNHGVSLTVSSARLARIFAHFGTSSATKHIPDWMLFEKPTKQAEMVLGFFRGDGNYIKTRYPSGPLYEKFRLSTTSKVLAYQLRDVLLRLGIVATVNARDRRRENRKTMYTIIVGGAFLKPFGNLAGIPVEETINAHKRATLFHLDKNYAYLPIRKSDARTVHKVPVYNFSVEGDETYVAGGAAVHNCTAPVYSSDSLHSAVVELIAMPHAHIRYTTIQNWSKNVYNLVTKRAIAHENAIVEWLDGNLGSKLTMKYPGVILAGRKARGEVVSVAFSGKGQHQDAGAKMTHLAPETSSTILSKSISKDGGRTSYRGLVQVHPEAENVKSSVRCDALLMDEISRSDTYPTMEIDAKKVRIEHEATVSKVGEEQLFYLMSRGLKEQEATTMIVNGFFEAFAKELPLEYAVELNRLVQLEMEGSVG